MKEKVSQLVAGVVSDINVNYVLFPTKILWFYWFKLMATMCWICVCRSQMCRLSTKLPKKLLPLCLPTSSSISTVLFAFLWLQKLLRSDKKVTTTASRTLIPTRVKTPTQKLARNKGQKTECLMRTHRSSAGSFPWMEGSAVRRRRTTVWWS